MPVNAASLEAQVTALDASSPPVVKAWSARSGQAPSGFTFRGGSKLTLTNLTSVEVEIRRDDIPIGDLGGRDLMTITLDPTAPQLVTFTPKTAGTAGGFLVVHDSRVDWELDRPDARHTEKLAGPTTLALVSHPRSEFAVELVAGRVKVPVKPGEASTVVLDAEQARSIVLRRFGGATGDTAQGAICMADGERRPR